MGITEVVTVGIDKQESNSRENDEDPRKQRSRSRLLDAATTLLAEGGVDAVTIDAVTKLANVARATLYRPFRQRHGVTRRGICTSTAAGAGDVRGR